MKHELFRGSDDGECLENDYPWTLSNEERNKNSEAKQRDLAEETLSKLY